MSSKRRRFKVKRRRALARKLRHLLTHPATNPWWRRVHLPQIDRALAVAALNTVLTDYWGEVASRIPANSLAAQPIARFLTVPPVRPVVLGEFEG